MSITKFLVFTIVSSVEYVAIFTLMFSLFRIRFHGYKPHLVLVCLSLSYLSFTLRQDSLTLYAPFVQILLLIVLMWLLFRFQVFYAAIMTVFGYLGYSFVQLTVYYISTHLIPDAGLFRLEVYSVAIISAFVTYFISVIIRRKNWGFSFVPHNEEGSVNYRQRENVQLLVAMILSIIGFIVTYSFALTLNTTFSFIITLAFLILSVTILIYISHKKEEASL